MIAARQPSDPPHRLIPAGQHRRDSGSARVQTGSKDTERKEGRSIKSRGLWVLQ